MQFRKKLILTAMLGTAVAVTPAWANHTTTTKNLTLIQMGDVHGHLYPRPNVRSDGVGRMEGGLARMKTKIDSIRSDKPYSMLVHTGDTLQGSGEALYTRGKAMVDVLDLFKIDVYTPGNWDFVYGKSRFVEFFANTTTPATSKRWGALSANVYNDAPDAAGLYDGKVDAGATTVLPGTKFKLLNSVKIGIIGCTTTRGPQVVGTWVTDGLAFTDCAAEVKTAAAAFRNPARVSSGKGDPGGAVDLVILASEIEIGRNIQLMKELDATNHVDIVFNSDMHEEVSAPIKVTTAGGLASMIVEQGMDGTAIGQFDLKIDPAKTAGLKIVSFTYKQHRIDDSISENSTVKSKVASVSYPYLRSGYKKPTTCNSTSIYWNMFSETCLHGPLDAEVGEATAALHRSNFDDEAVPAALEGSSHNWIADAIRWWAGSDIATVRGFRYGTTVKAGSDIRRNDLFHYVPIGPRVGKASRISMAQIRNQVDNSSRSVFGSDPAIDWRGGWMFAYSGTDFSLQLDPYSVSKAAADGSGVDWNATNGNQYYNPANPIHAGVDPFAANRKSSRARNLMVRMSCDKLPTAVIAPETLSEQQKCLDAGTGSAVAQIVNGTDGNWIPVWSKAFAAPLPIVRLTVGTGVGTSAPWVLANATAAAQNQVPVLVAAGYWYQRNPQTLNNCPNCTPFGTSSDKTLSDATPYILPVNADAAGNPSRDSNGIPLVKVYTDADLAAGTIPAGAKVGDWIPDPVAGYNFGKPQVLGRAIDLVEVLEKYLATGDANPTTGRVTLWNGATLPGRTTFGFPVMQPLCGTVGKDPLNPGACP